MSNIFPTFRILFLRASMSFLALSVCCAHQKTQPIIPQLLPPGTIAVCPIAYDLFGGPVTPGVYPQILETPSKEIRDNIRRSLEESFSKRGISATFIPEDKFSKEQVGKLSARIKKAGATLTLTTAEQEVFTGNNFPDLVLLVSGRSFSETEESYHQRIKQSCLTSALITVATLGCLIGIPTAPSVDWTSFNAAVIRHQDGRIEWKDEIIWRGRIDTPETASYFAKKLVNRALPPEITRE